MKNKNTRRKCKIGIRRELSGLAFLLPAVVLIFLFKYVPIILGVLGSFFNISLVKLPGEFIGFDNYIRIFKDAKFYTDIFNNLKLLLYSTMMTFWPPILLAILLNEVRNPKIKTLYRVMFFIPAVTPAIANQILWKFIWQPDYGLANQIFQSIGLQPQMWLNSERLVYFCMHFPGLLICGGMNMVVFLAALQNIPNEQYEAACIDGASVLNRVRYVTIPNIMSTIITMFTLNIIYVFEALEGPMVLTGGGPAGATEPVLLYAYDSAVNKMDYGYTLAITTVVFLTTMILTIVFQRFTKRDEA